MYLVFEANSVFSCTRCFPDVQRNLSAWKTGQNLWTEQWLILVTWLPAKFKCHITVNLVVIPPFWNFVWRFGHISHRSSPILDGPSFGRQQEPYGGICCLLKHLFLTA